MVYIALPDVSEGRLTGILVRRAAERIADAAEADVAIAGGGPAGLTLAWLLSEAGLKVTLVEHYLGLGGGLRGGSSLLPAILVEEGIPRKLLEQAGVKLEPVEGVGELYLADPVEVTVKLAHRAVSSGARVLVGWHVEDLIVRGPHDNPKVRGLVVVLSPTVEAGWHVDPIYIQARATVDATGHDGHLLRILEKRFPGLISVPGMSSMNVWEGEKEVVENTGKIIDGLYVTGMSVAEAHNTYRMGPVFGGMLASAAKLAEIIKRDLSQ
ncbi:MAG: sulfide-dependent adenosine diphosphate thiazole synthase [Desulfurococcales archaeon]|nr:sulfide-dependent adenosine diphosphate thiazole synthase [Desulfurococcales archaeon]